MGNGIVIVGAPDATIEAKASALRLSYTYATHDELTVPYDCTLIVASGTDIPWHMLKAAWHFLERWDAAVPFWRYGVLAADIGTEADRAKTVAVIRDLRVLVHSVELLFVENNDTGRALVDLWRVEMADGGDKQLAFLRALYTVKPRLCVLPTAWLASVEYQSKQSAYQQQRRPIRNSAPLVRVEVAPGRFVQVHKGDEQKAAAAYQEVVQHGRAKFK